MLLTDLQSAPFGLSGTHPKSGTLYGIRTRVSDVKGRRPKPLDEQSKTLRELSGAGRNRTYKPKRLFYRQLI